jgi:hypothetical protein
VFNIKHKNHVKGESPMFEKTVTILQFLEKVLGKNGDTIEDVEALLVGKVDRRCLDETGVLYCEKEAICEELTRPYEYRQYQINIPDFYAWTHRNVYVLHAIYNSDHIHGDTYDTEIVMVPRNPIEMYPENVSP